MNINEDINHRCRNRDRMSIVVAPTACTLEMNATAGDSKRLKVG